MVTDRLGFAFAFAFALVALCLNGRAAHAQASPVPYWTSGWQTGFGGGLTAGPRYGSIAGFDGSDSGSGSNFSARYNFSNGWFVGSERGGLGLSMNGFSQDGAWSNARPPNRCLLSRPAGTTPPGATTATSLPRGVAAGRDRRLLDEPRPAGRSGYGVRYGI